MNNTQITPEQFEQLKRDRTILNAFLEGAKKAKDNIGTIRDDEWLKAIEAVKRVVVGGGDRV